MIFCGPQPVFTDLDRVIRPDDSLEPARVPSAFWKVIVYIGKPTKELEVNAFFAWQDDESLQAMGQVFGNNQVDPFKIYQSSTTLIEEMTGIEFPEIAFRNNAMFFFESDITRSRNIVTPQLNEVSTARGPDCGIIFRQPN
jgi:endonuclease G